jgi:hypothetical protein
VNFRFCVLKDGLDWRVRDSDIECVCVRGEVRKAPAQGNLRQARLVSSLVISNVTGIIRPGVGKTRA